MEEKMKDYYPMLYDKSDAETDVEEKNEPKLMHESYQNRLPPIIPRYTPTTNKTNPSSAVIQIPMLNNSAVCTEKSPLLGIPLHQTYSTSSTSTSTIGKSKKIEMWFILFLLFYITYLVVGSVTFQTFEIETEMNLRDEFRKTRDAFLKKHSTVGDDDLEQFIAEVVKINGRGVSALRNASSDLNWSFGQALFFSSTVITTIGYGHVTPLTQNGKIFCILYATIGIPLTLVLLSAVVERLLIPVNWILGALNSKLGHLYQPFNIRLLHLGVIVSIFAVFFLAIPTIIFTHLESSWDPLDAFYYCFVSLTTIGLGDYIPGDELNQSNRSLYKIGTTCYLIVGLIAMMLTLTVFYDIPQLNLGQLFTESGSEHTEKLRLSLGNTPCYSGPSGLYIPQRNDEVRRSVVRIRPRGDDSPSPDDETPIHAKDMRVP